MRLELALLLAVVGAPVDVRVHPQPALQGDIVVLDAASQPSSFSVGSGTPQAFFANDGEFVALVGVDAEARPGAMPLVVEWPDRDQRLSIQVKARKFPSERLTVEPKYVEPPAEVMERINAEKERLERLWRTSGEQRLWHRPFARPIEGVPNSSFGLQRIFNGQRRSPHNGVDFPAAAGIPVGAANAGRVAVVDDLYFTGNTVVIDHGLGLYTVYAHLSEFAVHPGDVVERGAVIGRVGATGRATGPHLHWGARLLEARVDPLQLLGLNLEARHGTTGR